MTGVSPRHRAYTRLDDALAGLTRREIHCVLAGLLPGLLCGALIAGVWLNAAWNHTLTTRTTQQLAAHQNELAVCQQAQRDAATARDLATASDAVCRSDLARLRTVPTPALTLPLPPAPPPRTTSSATSPPPEDTTPTAPAGDLPPRPRPRPFAPSPSPSASGIPPAPAVAPLPATARAVTLQVGDDATLGEGVVLHLIAVSRRNSGALCILGAEGAEALRVPSGKAIPLTYHGQNLLLSATVQSADSCRVALQAR